MLFDTGIVCCEKGEPFLCFFASVVLLQILLKVLLLQLLFLDFGCSLEFFKCFFEVVDLVFGCIGDFGEPFILLIVDFSEFEGLFFDIGEHLFFLFESLLWHHECRVHCLLFKIFHEIQFVVELAVGVLIESFPKQYIEVDLNASSEIFNEFKSF